MNFEKISRNSYKNLIQFILTLYLYIYNLYIWQINPSSFIEIKILFQSLSL